MERLGIAALGAVTAIGPPMRAQQEQVEEGSRKGCGGVEGGGGGVEEGLGRGWGGVEFSFQVQP